MPDIHNWKLVLCTTVGVALGCLGATPQLAQAQSSITGWPEHEGDFQVSKGTRVSFSARAAVLRLGTFASPEEQQKFEDFYNKAVFPHTTDKDNRLTPAEDVILTLRKDLATASRAPQPNVYDKLAEITLAYMTKVATSTDIHPVARINAVLAIGELNTPDAAQALVDAVHKGAFSGIRVAAMTGLVRMAGLSGKGQLPANPNFGPQVTSSMIMLAKFHPKKSEGVDGFYWMRGQAADVLAELKSTGPKGEVPAALLAMLSDTELPIPLRSKAAWALGKLDYVGSAPAAGPYLKALAELADDALSSDQATNRGRIRLIARDTLEGLKPFSASNLEGDQEVIEVLKKTLEALNKDTEEKMAPDELKAAVDKAKAPLDSLLKRK